MHACTMQMRKLRVVEIIQCLTMLMAYTSSWASVGPLGGSKEMFPGAAESDLGSDGVGDYVYHGNPDLTRLLAVGACKRDGDLDIVSPLDGTTFDSLCEDYYYMTFVLFDLQLVQLKSVDPLAGSFRVQIQLVLHWIDGIRNGAAIGTSQNDCSFLCDTSSSRSLCCDNVWVPPLRLPRCDINNIESHTAEPPMYYSPNHSYISFNDCLNADRKKKCFWRRLWYLNIDATCANHMNFHNFPFDLQDLNIDFLNPYSSRTWFQVTKGFLKDNVDEAISDVNLSPDGQIPGWFVEDMTISSTCGASQTWQQTFLAQDALLGGLNNKDDPMGRYVSQHLDITNAFHPKNLTCSIMEDIYSSEDDWNLVSSANKEPYLTVKKKYEERVNYTLEKYRQCMLEHGKNFSWNVSVNDNTTIEIPGFDYFNTSPENINRSFSFFDLQKGQHMSKVWFPCAITAVANLTIPGIRVTIHIQRYRMFYVVKLILPTVACVAFSFSSFGLQPQELMGRLTVVVPSAIALTALQGFVVSTDIPPLAYLAPSTYIILISYAAQVIIAFESVLVNWLCFRSRPKWLIRGSALLLRKYVPTKNPDSSGAHIAKAINAKELNNEQGTNATQSKSATRIFDLTFMLSLSFLYTMAILICIILPWHHSQGLKKENAPGFIHMWQGSSN